MGAKEQKSQPQIAQMAADENAIAFHLRPSAQYAVFYLVCCNYSTPRLNRFSTSPQLMMFQNPVMYSGRRF
jgi:hypothetical protein